MPTYDYQCDSCGHLFEAFQSMSEDPLRKCPNCEEEALRRLISGGSGVIFRGSGFYVTDSRSSGASSGSKKGEASNEKKSEGKGDSKSSDGEAAKKSTTSTDAA